MSQVPWTIIDPQGEKRCKARIWIHPTRGIVCKTKVILVVVEGEHCVWLKYGTRLPRACVSGQREELSKIEDDVVGLWLVRKEVWRQKNRGGTGLWSHEDVSGVECLSDLLEQDGVKDYTPVKTTVPTGWRLTKWGKMKRIEKSWRYFKQTIVV